MVKGRDELSELKMSESGGIRVGNRKKNIGVFVRIISTHGCFYVSLSK